MSGPGQQVFCQTAVDGDSGDGGTITKDFHVSLTILTLPTGMMEPGHSHCVPFPQAGGFRSKADNPSRYLVARNDGQRHETLEILPLSADNMEI